MSLEIGFDSIALSVFLFRFLYQTVVCTQGLRKSLAHLKTANSFFFPRHPSKLITVEVDGSLSFMHQGRDSCFETSSSNLDIRTQNFTRRII